MRQCCGFSGKFSDNYIQSRNQKTIFLHKIRPLQTTVMARVFHLTAGQKVSGHYQTTKMLA
jgi:hypothetical protein